MIKLKFIQLNLIMCLLSAIFLVPFSAHAISKCQDETGKWHYGDSAAAACGDAKITIINKKGKKVKEIGPPLTDEEVKANKAEAKRKKQEKQERAKLKRERKRILAIYPREESIIRARDSRLKGMDKNIRLQEDLLDSMRLEMKDFEAREIPKNDKARVKQENSKKRLQKSIDEYYQSITRLRREREQTSEKYEHILTEFRFLTTQ